jgi:hypothetical protein
MVHGVDIRLGASARNTLGHALSPLIIRPAHDLRPLVIHPAHGLRPLVIRLHMLVRLKSAIRSALIS